MSASATGGSIAPYKATLYIRDLDKVVSRVKFFKLTCKLVKPFLFFILKLNQCFDDDDVSDDV